LPDRPFSHLGIVGFLLYHGDVPSDAAVWPVGIIHDIPPAQPMRLQPVAAVTQRSAFQSLRFAETQPHLGSDGGEFHTSFLSLGHRVNIAHCLIDACLSIPEFALGLKRLRCLSAFRLWDGWLSGIHAAHGDDLNPGSVDGFS
jgi:hypothetical protein